MAKQRRQEGADVKDEGKHGDQGADVKDEGTASSAPPVAASPRTTKWVMTERKLLTVSETTGRQTAFGPAIVAVQRFFNPGDDVPPGHEGRDYTAEVAVAVASGEEG